MEEGTCSSCSRFLILLVSPALTSSVLTVGIVLGFVQKVMLNFLCRTILSIQFMRQDKEDGRGKITQSYSSQNLVLYFTAVAADSPI